MIYKNSKKLVIKLWLGIFLFAATIIFPNLGQTACGMRICAIDSKGNSSIQSCCNPTRTSLKTENHTNFVESSCCGKNKTTTTEHRMLPNTHVNICSCTDLYQYISVNSQHFQGFPTLDFCKLTDDLAIKGITDLFFQKHRVEGWIAFIDPPIFLQNCVFLC